jgi:hypothetical protein
MRGLAFALLALCGCLSGCLGRGALREPSSPDRGAIVMAVEFKGAEFPYFRRHKAEELFFAQVGPDGGLDPNLVPANFRAGDRLYALDLVPGKYALVAASYFTGRTRQLAKFEGDRSKQWVVEVKPGELVFGGSVLMPRKFPGWGDFIVHGFLRAVSYLPPFKRAVIPAEIGLSKTDLSRGLELQALRSAREDLAPTYWAQAADTKLVAYGNPPPALTTGHWHKKAVPRKRAESFTWVDTLGWGEPQRIAGGLQWRRAKAPIWIAVTYVPAQGERAKALDAELAALREAGAPEDSHTLSEVAVSSKTALAAVYTTYLYAQAALVGSDVSVLKTMALVVPAKEGYYKLQYRASAGEFERWRPDFARFIRYLDLAPPPLPEKL